MTVETVLCYHVSAEAAQGIRGLELDTCPTLEVVVVSQVAFSCLPPFSDVHKSVDIHEPVGADCMLSSTRSQFHVVNIYRRSDVDSLLWKVQRIDNPRHRHSRKWQNVTAIVCFHMLFASSGVRT